MTALARKRASKKPSSRGDRQLVRYRSMRDFDVTSEPSGTGSAKRPDAKTSALPFVIQKHAATRLHYDFRLGWNGVLKSWAVTRGPSYFPGDKRLAVQVEDHPLEYGSFEGIIPKGQYGGGTVMLWDRGTWEPLGDVEEGLKKGNLKFTLHGAKLKGNWVLVRMSGRAAHESKPNWLLIKEHDSEARSADKKPITETAPNSVATGRDLDAIAGDKDRVRTSGGEAAKKRVSREDPAATHAPGKAASKTAATVQKRVKKSERNWLAGITGATQETIPAFIAPQLASMAKSPPEGDHWLHELKLDGYRIQARVRSGDKATVQLLTRTGLDWTHRMKPIAAAVAELPVKSAVLDGEVVVLASDGTSSFADLQAAFQDGVGNVLTYFVFDLLHLDGHNLRNLPLEERKKILSRVLAGVSTDGAVRLSEHLGSSARVIFEKACKLGAEGIISKLARAKYTSGRGKSWLKLKCYREQELVIGGFTLPSTGIRGVGALLLGYYRAGKLVYAGRAGTGFTQKTHRMMRDRFDKLQRATSPFESMPAAAGSGARWVKPELVAQISFATWTADNLVRQAAFKGLREDKLAKTVRREEQNESGETAHRKKNAKASAAHRSNTVAAKRASAPATAKDQEDALPIRLTHPDKVLDSESGLTKDGLAHYYLAIAGTMLPYVTDRPLTLVRCVDGNDKPCFYQKHKNEMLPKDFGSVSVVDKKTGKPEPYITLSTSKALVELAQIGVMEVHPWGSRNQSLEMPDQIIFDLDPDSAIEWKTLAGAAIEVRERLKKAGLESFLKTTGGNGLHVVAPIRAEHAWATVKEFAHHLVLAMEKENPRLFITRMTKAARTRKIYLDYLRNERGATSIAAFSPRARAGAPVALPMSWTELKTKQRPRFLVMDFPTWKKRLANDPWIDMKNCKQRLKVSKTV